MNETEGFPDHREAADWSQRLTSCLPCRGGRTLINEWIPGVLLRHRLPGDHAAQRRGSIGSKKPGGPRGRPSYLIRRASGGARALLFFCIESGPRE